jgi:glycosidase
MQLFGRGLRRRLPSMLGGDQARMRMVYSLMFSLRGAPVLFYGEEIGMAENLEIEGRMSVRSPMQWSGEPNAGFSTAAQEKLRRPVVSGDDYGPSAVNVADQRRDTNSMLNWLERLIRRRKECPEIGWGTCQLLDAGAPSLFAQRFDWGDRSMIVLHNLAGTREHVRLRFDRCDDWEHLHDLLGDGDAELLQAKKLELDLDPYGYRWFRVHRKGQRFLP